MLTIWCKMKNSLQSKTGLCTSNFNKHPWVCALSTSTKSIMSRLCISLNIIHTSLKPFLNQEVSRITEWMETWIYSLPVIFIFQQLNWFNHSSFKFSKCCCTILEYNLINHSFAYITDWSYKSSPVSKFPEQQPLNFAYSIPIIAAKLHPNHHHQ